MIRVKKRNGNLEPMDITKIQKQTFDATKMLLNVSQSELELDAHIQFTDGISSEDIQKLLIQTAVSKIDIDKPDWTYVAARLTLYDLYHRVGKLIGGTKGHPYAHISKYLDYGFKVDRLHFNLQTTKYNLEKINDAIKPERDDLFTYLGIKTLLDRYLLRNQKGEVFELPQHLFMTVAMFLAQNEKEFPADLIDENKAKYSAEDYEIEARTFRAIQFYDVLSKFEVMLATPTLSNARTNRHQLSSCFVNSVPDNIEGIFDGFKEVALLSKYGGGIGSDWNLIRGMKSAIAGHNGAAGGVVPFLKIDNDIAIAVDQLGTRKGAIAVYLEPWHIDILEFLDLKKNSGEERRRTHDLFPALWIPDLFMERALKGEDLSLFSPDDVPLLSETYGEEFNKAYVAYEQDASINRVTIKAVEIWKKALQQYFETGSPYLCFKDNANRVNPNAHTGHIRSSNLCSEIFQNTKPNTYKFRITFDDGSQVSFDENQLITLDNGITKKAKLITSLDRLNGKQIFITDKERIDGETAVCNLASLNLSKVNTKEDMERVIPIAVRMLDNVIDLNFYPSAKVKKTNLKTRAVGFGVMGEAQFLAENKIHFGSQEHFDKIDEIMEIFSYNTILASHEVSKEKGSYATFNGSNWSKGIFPVDIANESAKDLVNRDRVYDWDVLREKVKTGVRNGYMMAIAPTSSISILVGTTQAIEPIYKRKWFEENMSGLIPVVAPNLSAETWEYYIPSFEVDQVKLIKAAAIRQKWIDQGQSTNVFVPSETTGKTLHQIYVTAWKLGNKSTYYLRSQSPSAKGAEHKKPDVVDRTMECSGCQ